MRRIKQEELNELVALHKKWLDGEAGGKQLALIGCDLRGSNLSGSDLRGSNLRGSDLRGSDLRGSNLSGSNLRGSNLRGSNLSGSNLSGSNLRGSNLRGSNLSGSNLSGSDLRGSNLRGSNLSGSNLSGAQGILPASDYMAEHFERTSEGYIAYKTFGEMYAAPESWKIEPGSVISENVNLDRCRDCGCGINVATLDWVKSNAKKGDIWKVLIRWEWLPGVCVPYNTDGKIRCERVELVEIVER